ncbi:DNA-3-methyladenine glycosylase family protein [Rufibacter ruber]|uniref:DNA-3-methyladenine glycosylase family protein n=1 Tax=Rufibacter ruber TaxID=1783499 RepID=UPI00082BB058|nr:DNA-3-methyladenine glycosylase [Rufibacter ruber]
MNPHAALFSQDPVLFHLVKDQPPLPERLPAKSIYDALLSSVISQQLSVKAAATIKARFLALFPETDPKPEWVQATPDEVLRSVGLSGQKAKYLKSIAAFKAAGNLEDDTIAHLPDEELILHLTQIKGVGRWTSEMVLMFTLNRPDVMPLDDLGIYNAMKKLYGFTAPLKEAKATLLELSQPWRPHRTLACRYLWKSLDNAPV